MIKPGQKLVEGDWCLPMNESEALFLTKFMSVNHGQLTFFIREIIKHGCHYDNDVDGDILFISNDAYKKHYGEHTFPDFKQLCINTFGV